MPTNRDELIADWQNRLTAAQQAPAESSSRAAWLARLRLRLYRFLLSLYGQGAWNADLPGAIDQDEQPLVTDVHSTPVDGKPAKSVETIRGAIAKIAHAQESRPAMGPFAGGIDRNQWVIVASRLSNVDPQLAASALNGNFIATRIETIGRDVVVKVPLHHQTAAREFLATHRAQVLRQPVVRTKSEDAPLVVDPRPTASHYLIGLAIGPLLGIIAVGLMVLNWPKAQEVPSPSALLGMFLLVWISSGLVFGFLLRLKAHQARLSRTIRIERERRNPEATVQNINQLQWSYMFLFGLVFGPFFGMLGIATIGIGGPNLDPFPTPPMLFGIFLGIWLGSFVIMTLTYFMILLRRSVMHLPKDD